MQPWWADFLLVTWVGRVSCHFLQSTSSIARQADTPAVTQAVARLVFSCQKNCNSFVRGEMLPPPRCLCKVDRKTT